VTAELTASWLFVPGCRPDRFAKAVASGAHQVILDLEDAVAARDKESARTAAADWLSGGGSAWVRINASITTWHDADLHAVAGVSGLRGVLVPKAESPDEITRIAGVLPPHARIIALLETARGVIGAHAVAASPAVSGLAFGSVDFCLDIDAEASDDSLMFARGMIVTAARAAGLPGPLDGVTLEARDTGIVGRDARKARQRGFSGKLCIHPAQVPVVNSAFAPSTTDVDWAERVISSAPRSPDGEILETAFDLDGLMVDKPVLERARRIVARADRPQELS
jgi:citrate lyase subunit beta/citryl-CoA lyase